MHKFTEVHRNGEFSVTRESATRFLVWRDTATARAHCGTFDFPENSELARELAIYACDVRARTAA